MKCHYAVLGLPLNAAEDDIKKSYRKLALEWHPDKNLHRIEEATETFQLIQQAYDVLADPQERAWYDRNRDKILRDKEYADEHLDVYQYFNTSKYKGYGDDEKSFYTIYRVVFEKIVAEDKKFMDDDSISVPSFGYSYSPYKEVVYPFYAYWQSYRTAKPYNWMDKYDLAEARKCGVGRQVIRCMERENKKLREQHKRTRNEEIRQLVAFVRKRDKRIEDYRKLLEKQNAEKAKKAEELRRKQIADRKKHLENYKETEWTSMSGLEDNLTELEANLDSQFGAKSSDKGEDTTSEADGMSDYYCIACDKVFRSTKAMTNHLNSKKHRENVGHLEGFMDEVDSIGCDCDLGESNEQDEPKQSASKGKKKKKKKAKDQLNEDTDASGPGKDSTEPQTHKCEFCSNSGTSAPEEDPPEESDEKGFFSISLVRDYIERKIREQELSKMQKQDTSASGPGKDSAEPQTHHKCGCCSNSEASAPKADLSEESDEKGFFSRFSVHKDREMKSPEPKFGKTPSVKLSEMPKQDHEQNAPVVDEDIDRSCSGTESNGNNCEDTSSPQLETAGCSVECVMEEKTTKKSKGAQRKAKKKSALNAEEQAQQVTTTCVKCGKVFESRNRLFDHLKETGHSTFLSDKDRESLKLKKKREP